MSAQPFRYTAGHARRRHKCTGRKIRIADRIDELRDPRGSGNLRRIGAQEPQPALDQRPAQGRGRIHVQELIPFLWEHVDVIRIGRNRRGVEVALQQNATSRLSGRGCKALGSKAEPISPWNESEPDLVRNGYDATGSAAVLGFKATGLDLNF